MSTTPPQNLEAEESVLGACILSEKAIERVVDTGLAFTDFYRESNGRIYQGICRLFDSSEPVDAITLADELERAGSLEKIGGHAKLAELAALVPATGNVTHYAEIVRETAGVRRLITAGQEIIRVAQGREGDLEQLVASAEGLLTEAVRPTEVGAYSSLAALVDELTAQIEDAIKSGVPRFGLRTGFPSLDTALTGLHPGQLVLVAARPAMGKSALAQNIAENVADQGGNVALNSLEMSREEVLLRSLSRASRIESKRLRTGQVNSDEVQRFFEAKKRVKDRAAFFVDDDSGVTLSQLRAKLKRLHRKEPLSLVVVDYIQLMLSPTKTDDNRQAQVAAISRGLKLVARELNVPVIALSQLNRNVENRPDKRPMLSDLRDSGALEQDADVILFVYRDEYYNPLSDKAGIAEVIVGKNRMGESTTVELAFSGRQTSFLPLRPVEKKEAA